jgi:hypothetical protein
MRHSDVETFGFRSTDAGRTVAYSVDSAPCDALDPKRAARDAAYVFDGPVEVAHQGATYVVG